MSNNTTTVQPGQTLADIAILHYGTTEALPYIAAENGLSVSASVAQGEMLVLPTLSLLVKPEKQPEKSTQAFREVVVQPGQTLPDIAIQYTGGVDAWNDIASLNGLGIGAVLQAGSTLKIPAIKNKKVAAFYSATEYFPAAGAINTYGEGISWWGIEIDFIVS